MAVEPWCSVVEIDSCSSTSDRIGVKMSVTGKTMFVEGHDRGLCSWAKMDRQQPEEDL